MGDPSRVDSWVAGTSPPVILRHDRGLRRGEAAGFNTRRKASGTDGLARGGDVYGITGGNHGQHISPAARAPACFKTNWQFRQITRYIQ